MKRTYYALLGMVLCTFTASKCLSNNEVFGILNVGVQQTEQASAFSASLSIEGDNSANAAKICTLSEKDSFKLAKTAIKQQLEIPGKLKRKKERIIKHKAYILSYNSDTKLPNWVAWKLTPDRFVQNVDRKVGSFLPDPVLNKNEAVNTNDYNGGDWDRGHMCPANDNRWDSIAMCECFYMTNMCPQNPNLNRGDWKELEDDCHDWALKEGVIYIACGPIFYNQTPDSIGKHNVKIPSAFFKVILCLGRHPKAIGFIYNNIKDNKPLAFYAKSVDEVERITKIDFFPTLPNKIENQVETQCNINDWQISEQ